MTTAIEEPELATKRPPTHEAAVGRESRWVTIPCSLLAVVLAAGFLWFILRYWAPAHAGNNQNGYLVSGKLIAETGSPGFEPKSPFEFVGWMWGMADANSTAPGGGVHYAKYPLGYPLLVAATWRVAPPDRAAHWAHLVNPVATAIGLLGVFVLAAQLMPSPLALLAMLLAASNPVLLILANNPNSHATAVAFVVWGIVGVVLQLHRGWFVAGVVGAFLLGYACTIRYTEGLLVLPVLLASILQIRRRWKSLVRVAIPLAAWALPVAVQVIFNRVALGAWTGYDSTGESTGFAFDHFDEKWRFAIRELYATGAYFLLPLAVLALVAMVQWRWKTALVFWLWLIPGAVIYMAYYWGQGLGVWGFLRFYATLLPGIVILAAWTISRVVASLPRQRIGTALAAILFVATVVYLNLDSTRGALERDHAVAGNVAYSAKRVIEHAPSRSLLFGESQRMLNHLQFRSDFELFGGDWLLGQFPLPRIRTRGETDANPIQPARRAFLESRINGLTSSDRGRIVREAVDRALAENRGVFVLLTPTRAAQFRERFLDGYAVNEVDRWTEPNALSEQAMRNLNGIGSTGTTDPAPRTWVLLQVIGRKPTTLPTTTPVGPAATPATRRESTPATQPSTAPSTRPATAPTR